MSSRSLTAFVRSLVDRRSAGSRAALIAGAALSVLAAACAPASASYVLVTNIITNSQSAHKAKFEDADLTNPWGVSFSPGGSTLWVSDNHSSVTTAYNVDPRTNNVLSKPVRVPIPGDGSPTGQVFNNSDTDFKGDPFLFVSEDGTISGWRSEFTNTGKAEVLQAGSAANVYKGVTLVSNGANSYLLSANFLSGHIDVMKGNAAAPNLAGNFTGPSVPAGYAPFNVQTADGHVFVSYAPRETDGIDDVKGAGNGIIDEFNPDGTFVRRIAQGGSLNDPWGMVIAPKSFGDMAGDLLVANQGDGTISVFDLVTDSFVGLLKGANGKPLEIDGLWALTVGNDGAAGSSQMVYFTAGPDDEENGLVGALNVPEPASIFLVCGGLAMTVLRRRTKAAATV